MVGKNTNSFLLNSNIFFHLCLFYKINHLYLSNSFPYESELTPLVHYFVYVRFLILRHYLLSQTLACDYWRKRNSKRDLRDSPNRFRKNALVSQ